MSDTIVRADTAAAPDLTNEELLAASIEFEAIHDCLLVYDPSPAGAALPNAAEAFDRFLREYAERPERLIVEIDLT